MERCYASEVQNVDAVLPLAFAPVPLESGTIPINPQNIDAKILEVILVGRDREQQRNCDVRHGEVYASSIISRARLISRHSKTARDLPTLVRIRLPRRLSALSLRVLRTASGTDARTVFEGHPKVLALWV